MAYHGFKPAEQAIQIGADEILSSHISDGVIVNADVNASAAIATSKVSGAVTSIGSHGLGSLATLSAVASAQITDGTIVNADVNNSAAIATSKLSGSLTSVGSHGLATSATTDTTNASNISSGTLAAARVATLNQNTTGTAATVTGATQSAITSLGTLTALTVDDITLNGSTISDSSDLTLDMGGDIILDAGGSDILLKVAGTTFGSLRENSSNFRIKSEVSDKDIVFMGNDGGSEITALTLDMSEAGKAIFTGQCQASSFLTGDLILKSPTNNGHYTIWEEEDYLAIRNELKGKTYKFVLEEINE